MSEAKIIADISNTFATRTTSREFGINRSSDKGAAALRRYIVSNRERGFETGVVLYQLDLVDQFAMTQTGVSEVMLEMSGRGFIYSSGDDKRVHEGRPCRKGFKYTSPDTPTDLTSTATDIHARRKLTTSRVRRETLQPVETSSSSQFEVKDQYDELLDNMFNAIVLLKKIPRESQRQRELTLYDYSMNEIIAHLLERERLENESKRT